MTRTRALVCAAVLALLIAPATRAAADEAADFAHLPRIRTADARLRRLIQQGMRRSSTFKALVDRLQRSDVVVYVQCDGDPRSRLAGRLTFVSSAGGFRYVVARLAPLDASAQQIAILAHELQHAVEIADTPAIVDSQSLAREYLRIGHVNVWSPLAGISFDSEAAVAAGRLVAEELAGMPAD
jgi:hypothetical protein